MDPNPRRKHQFDVFISFCGTDRDWVMNVLRPWLVEQKLKPCDYLKDFLPGKLKVRNMHEAVYSSRHTLAVLSPEYLSSNNCAYEAELAVDKGVEERENCLIPIFRRACDVRAATDVTLRIAWLEFREEYLTEGTWANLLKALTRGRQQLETHEQAKVAAERVSTAMTALVDSMGECPAMLEAVRLVEGEFSAVDRQLREVEFYKRVHNQLHEIDMHCCRMLTRCAPDFPAAATVADCRNYRGALGRALKELRNLSEPQRRPHSTDDLRWVVTLGAVHDTLGTALEQKDKVGFDTARRELDRVLTMRPSQIDALLRTAANKLQLDRLADAINRICDQSRTGTTNLGRLQILQESGHHYRNLDSRLKRLSEQHQSWQELETGLQRISSMVEQGDLSYLLSDWPHVRTDLHAACAGVDDPEVADLLELTRSLDACLAEQNNSESRSVFRSLCHCASTYFFDIDKALLAFCDNIPVMRLPLQDVLRQLSKS